MRIIVQRDDEAISKYAARLVSRMIRQKPKCVLGLAAGRSPLGLYRELIRAYQDEGLDFSEVTTFNLDEYLGLSPAHQRSYSYFMHQNLFGHINIDPRKVNIPEGTVENGERHSEEYEQKILEAGGIDLQILGIGVNGHIAFNEPGSALDSRTRIMSLTEGTRRENARFFKAMTDVPSHVITVGVGTIMDARSILLLASGNGKAKAIRGAVMGPVSSDIPASVLQRHPDVSLILDEEAASLLPPDLVS